LLKSWRVSTASTRITNEAWKDQKPGFYYAVVGAMLKTGFREDEIAKVGGGNFCRVFDAATTSH
jgi:membrane dipeptidase